MWWGEKSGESVFGVLWPCFSIPSHLFWPLSKASLVAPWHGLTPRQTSSMLKGHLIWCLIHTVLWHLKTRVSLCCGRVPLEGTVGLFAPQSHTGRHIADAHSLIQKHEHAPVYLGRSYASCWRALPNTQALSLLSTHIEIREEKKCSWRKN